MHLLARKPPGVSALTIAANTTNVNLKTLAGNPSVPVDIVLTINSGVIVYSTGFPNYALEISFLPAGSTVKIINNGQIAGAGGVGGNGASHISSGNNTPGTGGDPGRTAIYTDMDLTIDNTGGYILGGGGGGGGGGGKAYYGEVGWGGGGGGGGAGYNNPAGGSGGLGIVVNGTSGTGGTGAGGGNGGPGGWELTTGGFGGEWGRTGTNGSNSDFSGGTGGAAGKAIDTSGHSITWLGGNNPSQVQGDVS